MKHKRIWLMVGLLLLVLILDRMFGWSAALTSAETLSVLRRELKHHFVPALLLYMVFTAVSCVLLALPGVTFALAAGVLFGPLWGTLACSAATTLGACLSFLAGRYMFKDALKPKLKKNAYLNRLLFAESGRSTVFLLAVTRLVPLFPFNLQNFVYGVTDIGFGPYALYSALFMLPGTAVYTVGAAGLLDTEKRGPYLLFSALLLAVVLGLSRLLKRRAVEDRV